MVVGMLLSGGGEVEEVQVSVCAPPALVVAWRGVTVAGIVQPHSPVVVFELGTWHGALTDAEVFMLPPMLSSRLLVLPCILLARQEEGGVGELRTETYLSWLHEGNCTLGALYRRMARMSLHPLAGTMDEKSGGKKRGGGPAPPGGVRVKPGARVAARRKGKGKQVSEESEENCQDDACEDEEDGEEEEGVVDDGDEDGDDEEELNDELVDRGDECEEGDNNVDSEVGEDEEEDEERDLLSTEGEEDEEEGEEVREAVVVKGKAGVAKSGGSGRRKKARVDETV